MAEPLCAVCGLPESEHHEFQPVSRPDGCVCDVGTWANAITPVCDKYEGDGVQYCLRCEHDKECHKEVKQ